MIRIYDVPPTAEPSSQIPAQTHDRPQVPRPAHRGPLAHELAFGALYALVLVRLVLAPAGPAWSEIGVWLGLAAATTALIWSTRRWPTVFAWRVRLGGYLVLMNMAYARMGAVAHALGSQSQDPTLQAIDHRLFGQPLPLVFDAWVTPLASDLLSACYVLFFPYLLVSCARQVWRAGTDLEQAQRFHAGVFSVYAAGFIGYLLMPAAGPYLAMPDAFSHTITGGWMTALNDAIVRRGSNHVDVFPSLHVAVSAFLLGFDRTYARWRFRAYCIPAVGLWVSTLYLRYHYGIDVAAGFALAAVGLWLAYRAPSLGAIETTQATTDTTPAPAGSVVLPVPLSRDAARVYPHR